MIDTVETHRNVDMTAIGDAFAHGSSINRRTSYALTVHAFHLSTFTTSLRFKTTHNSD